MNTKDLMNIALEMANLSEEPHDTGINVDGNDIKKVIIGIDMDVPEIIVGKQLEYDLVVSHHPKTGESSMNFHKVLDVQIDRMVSCGVPINKAQKALKKRIAQLDLLDHVGNYDRTQSIAKLLNMPYMNIHLPADIIGERIVQDFLDNKFIDKPKAVLSEVVDALNEIEEYQNSLAKPKIRVGSPDDYAGKIVVLMAGGTNGGENVFKAYFDHGVGTIICMHIPENVKKAVEEQNIGNVIVAGHMSSDSIGLNRIIKAWEDKGIEVTKVSGIN